MNQKVSNLYTDLAKIDPSLKIKPKMLGKLTRRQIKPAAYSRQALFSSMASGDAALFDDYPSPLTGTAARSSIKSSAINQIETTLKRLGRYNRFHVRCGPSEASKYLTGQELVQRWNNPCARMNVTDLHIRGTALERLVDPDILSWFNLLPNCGTEAASEEMMSLVVSSRGCISDSHSDAADSSNYCFTGEKVWLFWDTYEGKKLGLEDCSIDTVYSGCSFDMERFLQLRSARWLTVSKGQALFLPGEYTHKVITTERYLGVGSFYLSLPNSLRSLSRWNIHGPLWSEDQSANADDDTLLDITRHVQQRVRKLRSRSIKFRQKLGYDFLPNALDNWQRSIGKRQQLQITASRPLSDYIQLLREV